MVVARAAAVRGPPPAQVLVGDGKECPVAPRLEQGWLAAPARAALDVPALLAADVGRLDTLPITLAGRKDLRLSWEVWAAGGRLRIALDC